MNIEHHHHYLQNGNIMRGARAEADRLNELEAARKRGKHWLTVSAVYSVGQHIYLFVCVGARRMKIRPVANTMPLNLRSMT